MSLDVNVRDTIGDVLADFDRISEGITSKASVRAANFAARGVRTESSREIRKVYNVKARAIRAATKLFSAKRQRNKLVQASVLFQGSALPLIDFGARAVSPWNIAGRRRKSGGGVTVNIKKAGGRKLIAGAFISTAKSGKKLVLKRILPNDPSVLSSRRQRRTSPRGRYPIKALTTLDIPLMVSQRRIFEELSRVGQERFRREFLRQLNLLISQGT